MRVFPETDYLLHSNSYLLASTSYLLPLTTYLLIPYGPPSGAMGNCYGATCCMKQFYHYACCHTGEDLALEPNTHLVYVVSTFKSTELRDALHLMKNGTEGEFIFLSRDYSGGSVPQ